VVKDGLGDREGSVRIAAGKVVDAWFDGIVSEGSGTIIGDILGFLQIFDVVGPGDVAADALQWLFTTRKDVLDEIVFDGSCSNAVSVIAKVLTTTTESFWIELTPESALLARVFVDHCLGTNDEIRLHAASLPVVTAFAFHIRDAYNVFLELTEENKIFEAAAKENLDKEEEIAEATFVLCELLKVAVRLDYTNEIGRRRISAVVRKLLSLFSCTWCSRYINNVRT